MFVYEKKLQYPVKIKNTNPALAKFIISLVRGPDGELGASLRYLSQRYSMPTAELKGLLTDIGTEELGHLEMIGRHRPPADAQFDAGADQGRRLSDTYFVDHTAGVYATAPPASPGAPPASASRATSSATSMRTGSRTESPCDLRQHPAAV